MYLSKLAGAIAVIGLSAALTAPAALARRTAPCKSGAPDFPTRGLEQLEQPAQESHRWRSSISAA